MAGARGCFNCGPVAVSLFLDTYSQVEMLATWRAGAPDRREPLGMVPQPTIEQEVFGTSALLVRLLISWLLGS